MDDGFWICPTCSWVNKSEGSNQGCKACGRVAPPGIHAVPSQHPIPSAPMESPITAHYNSSTYPPPNSAPFQHAAFVPAHQPFQPKHEKPQPQSEQTPDDLWLCSKCSWVNSNTHLSCCACGQPAPPGTKHTASPTVITPTTAHPVPVTAQPYNPMGAVVSVPTAGTAGGHGKLPTIVSNPTANMVGGHGKLSTGHGATVVVPPTTTLASSQPPPKHPHQQQHHHHHQQQQPQQEQHHHHHHQPHQSPAPTPAAAPAPAKKDDFASGFASHPNNRYYG